MAHGVTKEEFGPCSGLYLPISDINGSDSTKQKWQFRYRHSTAPSVITPPPGRQMKSPGSVQPAFRGCKVARRQAHCRYRSGEANQLLHPLGHITCASSSGHTCTMWLYPNKGAFVCSLFTPALISASVKKDFSENEGHLHRISFSLLALSLLRSFAPHFYMMVRAFIAQLS